MFSTALKEVTGLLDQRFLINTFFPSFIFLGALLVVFFAGRGELEAVATAWNDQAFIFQIFQIVGFIACVTVMAGIVASQLNNILRFYEGYWPAFMKGLFDLGQRWHQAQLADIVEDPDRYEERYLGYPPSSRPEEIMPTRLGNILKNAELYPYLRYRIDAVLVWPRLYNLFPQRFIQTIADVRATLDFMLVISALSGLFALLSGVYLLIVGAVWWLFLICFWGGLLIAVGAYQGALGSALLYAEQIKVAFDLYRNELLKQMHLPLPATPRQEKEQWADIGQFVYLNNRNNQTLKKFWAYTDATPAQPSTERKETWLQRLRIRLGL